MRCHIEVEETVFFDTAQHYLTESDRRQLTEEFESVHYDEVEEGVQAVLGGARPPAPRRRERTQAARPGRRLRRPTRPRLSHPVRAPVAQIRVHVVGRLARRAHREDDRRGAGDDVAAGPHAGTLVRPDSLKVRM